MLKKIVAAFTVLLLLALALCIGLPIVFKSQLNSWVKERLNTNLSAKVDYSGAGITCFGHFPDIDFTLNNLTVTGDSFFSHDTLVFIEHFDITIAWHSIVSEPEYRVLQVNIVRPAFKFITDSYGHENWHILKQMKVVPGEGVVINRDSSKLSLSIAHYAVTGADVSYKDAKQNVWFTAHRVNLDGNFHTGPLSSIIYANTKVDELSGNNGHFPIEKLRLSAELNFDLNTDTLRVNNINAQMGKSRLAGGAGFQNVFSSLTSKSLFTGGAQLHSSFFDVGDWWNATGATDKPAPVAAGGNPVAGVSPRSKTGTGSPTDTSQNYVVNVNVVFDTLRFNKLLMQQAGGDITLSRDSVSLKNFSTLFAGGMVKVSAKLELPRRVQFEIAAVKCDIQQTARLVPLAGKISPVAGYAKGTFSCGIKGKGMLNKSPDIDYNSLEADGKIEINHAQIRQVPVLSDIGKLAKGQNLDNLEVNGVSSVMHCKNGVVTVEPTDVKFTNGFTLGVKGTNSFTGQINYDMRLDVPSKQMGGVAALAQSFLSAVPGLNVQIPQVLSFYFNVSGTFENPKALLTKVGGE